MQLAVDDLGTLLSGLSTKRRVYEISASSEAKGTLDLANAKFRPIADGSLLDALQRFVQHPYSLPRFGMQPEQGCQTQSSTYDEISLDDIRRRIAQYLGQGGRIGWVRDNDSLWVRPRCERGEVL